MFGVFFKVDSVIDICSDVMNLRSVSYECKCKLEQIKDDYKIEVSFTLGNIWMITFFVRRLGWVTGLVWKCSLGLLQTNVWKTAEYAFHAFQHNYISQILARSASLFLWPSDWWLISFESLAAILDSQNVEGRGRVKVLLLLPTCGSLFHQPKMAA